MPSSSISNGLDTGLLELAESARSLPHSAYRIPSSSTKTVAPATSRKSLKRLLKKNANTTIGKAKWCKNKLKQVQDKVNRLQKRIETLLERTQSLLITLEQIERGSKEIILTRQRMNRKREVGTINVSSRRVPTDSGEYPPTPPRTPGTMRALSLKKQTTPSSASSFEFLLEKSIKPEK